jgi:L-ascorbate metabolism protein UlaG (beta-lactamase superfamily)
MKNLFSLITILMVSAGLLSLAIVNPVYAQGLTLEEIRLNLINNPPDTGDSTLREQTILALDEILKHDSSRTSTHVLNFYDLMMNKVNTELEDTVSAGASIWMMYNHGFLVKTSQVLLAFDLVPGYPGWSTALPPQIIDQVDILFLSHLHNDHYNVSLTNAIKANGRYVVFPTGYSQNVGNVQMAPGDTTTILGIRIKAHDGLHSEPLRIYEVSTSNGLKILHTGDNQTSTTLPLIDSLDVLLLNAWVNESGLTSAVVGMRNCIYSVNPEVMIPGHIQELGHNYNPGNPAGRVPYEWAFAVDDVPVPAEVRVMAWGERFFVSGGSVGITEHGESTAPSGSFALHQNYPNPFNPNTHIGFRIADFGFVSLKVYDITGREVATLISENLTSGSYKYRWDAKGLANGVYFYRLEAEGFVQTKKMLLIR